MADEPWKNLPRTEESRDKLIAMGRAFEEEGKLREAGTVYLELASLLRWVPPGFNAAANCALRAVDLLRQTDDKAGLAAALRVSATCFAMESKPALAESLALARECGSRIEEARTLCQFGMSGNLGLVRQALKMFRELDNQAGIARCLSRLALHTGRPDQYLEAIAAYEAAGNPEEADRTRQMMELYTGPKPKARSPQS